MATAAEKTIHRLVRSPWFWCLGLCFLFSYPIFRSVTRELPPPNPVLGQVPPFRFTNQFGQEFGGRELKGRVYLANFAFTSCPTTCPALMQTLQKVQKRIRGLGQKVALVTFTVDPQNDTPEVLLEYARQHRANPFVWTFLTGEKAKLRELLVEGFKVPMEEPEIFEGKVDGQTVSLWDIAHTTKLVLVDGAGGIRGYYSTDEEGINHLMIDLGLLVNRHVIAHTSGHLEAQLRHHSLQRTLGTPQSFRLASLQSDLNCGQLPCFYHGFSLWYGYKAGGINNVQ